ncbi:hypothetical protein L2703_13945 [Shewanella basaltis]|uniref:hypothetical protein n=1 Tax=Shewanella basaltis TaxID=472183 RepID=UPI00200E849D|nr:hypothetical protein [Shewanella basaltis]MCL1114690.1 hypothetical protein [Shewanella basaltis]
MQSLAAVKRIAQLSDNKLTNAPEWGDTNEALAKSNAGIRTPLFIKAQCRQPRAGFLLRDSAHHYYGGLGEAAIWLAASLMR